MVAAQVTKLDSYVASSKIRAAVRKEIHAFNDGLAEAIGRAIGTVVQEAEARLEAKIAALADASNVFKGNWEQGTRYARGSVVSIPALGIYRALTDTDARPGSNDAWQLILKAGRDGRDGKDAPTEPPEPRTTRSHRSQR